MSISRETWPSRSRLNNPAACVLWFTGLPGSGKSTTVNAVQRRLHALGRRSYVLDSDCLRHGLSKDLGFTRADRGENVRRIAEVARLFTNAGLIVLVSAISPFRDQRDPKGLYRKARAGQIRNFTGIDSVYEPPENPELVLKTGIRGVQEVADEVIRYLLSWSGDSARRAGSAP